jgi:hypothetical protein
MPVNAVRLRDLGLLLALGLGIRLLSAWPLQQPGYTDAYYYAVGARQLHEGQGFNEPFIWNWLDPPSGVPHPGYLYWMPLTTILGWIGMTIGGNSFRAIQGPFVVLSTLLPLVACGIAWDLTGKRRHALFAGLLAVFPGYYAHVFVLPDNFTPFALSGSLCLWAAGRGLRSRRAFWFGPAGLAAGLAHLTRADGLLLLGVTLLAAMLSSSSWLSSRSSRTGPIPVRTRSRWKPLAISIAFVITGYLLVMGPWFVRNWRALGSPLPGAGTKTLFLTNYDDLFGYGHPLTLHDYLAWGWGPILESKWQALLLNLQRLWVEGLLVFLLPFAAAGVWRLRRDSLLWPFLAYLPLLLLVMTLFFTFPGMRGGLYHSGAALLPFFFAVSGPGLEGVLQAAARRFRHWQVQPAWKVFSAGLVVMSMLLTTFASWRSGVLNGAWNERDQAYSEIGRWLDTHGEKDAVVMVGDAPGFAWHTGHLAVAVPNNPLETVMAAADRYGAGYLVLDGKRPRTTDGLFLGEDRNSRLSLRLSENGWQMYEIKP